MDEEIVEEAGPHGGTRGILVVDDDARVRQALRALIESSAGLWLVGEASSVATALRAAETLAPDLVLLDLLLPSAEEGFELLALLVARGLVVVALSIREGLREGALRAGAAAFVEKSTGVDGLLEALGGLPPTPARAR